MHTMSAISMSMTHSCVTCRLQLGFGLRLQVQLHTGPGASSKSQEDKSQLLILYGRLVIIMSTFSAAFGEYDRAYEICQNPNAAEQSCIYRLHSTLLDYLSDLYLPYRYRYRLRYHRASSAIVW